MTLCAECKPLSYMPAEFNFLKHSLYTGIVSFSTPNAVLRALKVDVPC